MSQKGFIMYKDEIKQNEDQRIRAAAEIIHDEAEDAAAEIRNDVLNAESEADAADSAEQSARLPNFFEALLPIIVMSALMLYGYLGNSSYKDVHMPLLCATVVACFVGMRCGHPFHKMLDGMLKRLSDTMEAILIICTVGLLVASFIMSGTIPAVIYYGLNLLTPKLFLPIGCIICAIVGLACGSSWTATATIGIAFLGIGAGLGVNPAITAGMIISGAYVGDKFSPLSDTTNLAAAVAETGLFDHVAAMVSTTLPTYLIALVLYTILGLRINTDGYDPAIAANLQSALAKHFYLNPVLMIPVLVVIIACVVRLPSLVGIALAVFTGVIFAVIFQGYHNLGDIFNALHYGLTYSTGNETVDKLLNRGGLNNQMWTISLILLAVIYGGALESCGCITTLFHRLKKHLTTPGRLVVATLITSIFCDATMCDQTLGIGVPAPLYADKYDELGLSRSMLSRSLEDAGTLWAVLFPWTGCGAYQFGVLGVHPFAYFPFAFMNLINPFYAGIMALLRRNIIWADGAYTNILGKTKKMPPAAAPEEQHRIALANLEQMRREGTAPIPEE